MKSILLVDDSATVLLSMGNILVRPVSGEQLIGTIKLVVK
jgi:hypothetical protein